MNHWIIISSESIKTRIAFREKLCKNTDVSVQMNIIAHMQHYLWSITNRAASQIFKIWIDLINVIFHLNQTEELFFRCRAMQFPYQQFEMIGSIPTAAILNQDSFFHEWFVSSHCTVSGFTPETFASHVYLQFSRQTHVFLGLVHMADLNYSDAWRKPTRVWSPSRETMKNAGKLLRGEIQTPYPVPPA